MKQLPPTHRFYIALITVFSALVVFLLEFNGDKFILQLMATVSICAWQRAYKK